MRLRDIFRHKHAEPETPKKLLLDPNQAREDVTETGGEYAGRHPAESTPDIVKPGTGTQAEGQTTRG